MNRMLFAKTYSDESLYDLSQDMADFFDDPSYHALPEEDGFKKGTFHLSIIWHEDK